MLCPNIKGESNLVGKWKRLNVFFFFLKVMLTSLEGNTVGPQNLYGSHRESIWLTWYHVIVLVYKSYTHNEAISGQWQVWPPWSILKYSPEAFSLDVATQVPSGNVSL